jgi:hypothetical protein
MPGRFELTDVSRSDHAAAHLISVATMVLERSRWGDADRHQKAED